MVTVNARTGFSISIFDFSNIYTAESYVTKPMEFAAVYANGEDHFFGKDFTYNSDGIVKGGTATSFHFELSGRILFEILGFSVAVQTVIKASKTDGLSDDLAIFTKMFSGADVLNGSGANDQLEGFAGKDKLFGNGGVDQLIGGTGEDQLTGGGASDYFAFTKGSGVDTITDFSAAGSARDFIVLADYKGIDSFEDIADHIRAGKNGTTIYLDGGDRIFLAGVKSADLDATDFNF